MVKQQEYVAVNRIDSNGKSVDPTQNVKDLMDASIRSLVERGELQAQIQDEKIKRMEAGLQAQEKIAILVREHNQELRKMEADRVDKIRSVDVANAAASAAQLLSAVNNLATTAAATAETLRNQVASTAAAAITSQAALINPIVERVAMLEKSSYTGAGKSAVSDPAMAELVSEMRKLSATSQERGGKSEGLNAAWVAGIAAIGLFGTILTIGAMLYAFVGGGGEVAPAPQIIYVPAPATGVPLPITPQQAP